MHANGSAPLRMHVIPTPGADTAHSSEITASRGQAACAVCGRSVPRQLLDDQDRCPSCRHVDARMHEEGARVALEVVEAAARAALNGNVSPHDLQACIAKLVDQHSAAGLSPIDTIAELGHEAEIAGQAFDRYLEQYIAS